MFKIKMGIPEMKELWDSLVGKFKANTLNKNEALLLAKWRNALEKLSADPKYPSLNTHEIPPLTKRYGMKVWQSYLENKKSGALRMYWVYGPDKNDITIIALEPHPEDKKNGAYDKVTLSDVGEQI